MAGTVEPRRFAVFDIDGTLIRWQLYHAVADELARGGRLEKTAYARVREARMAWKKRGSPNSFHDYEQTLIDLFDAGIRDITVKELLAAGRRVIDEYKDQVYVYTRGLIEELRADGYLLFAISASQEHVVRMLADYYGFDDYGGSRYEVKDGYFTGQKQVLSREYKPAYLKKLVTKHGATWKGSIGVGDSESDIPLLSSVESPVAFNPSRDLFVHAKEAGWQLVIERKNVIYELAAHRETYRLKD